MEPLLKKLSTIKNATNYKQEISTSCPSFVNIYREFLKMTKKIKNDINERNILSKDKAKSVEFVKLSLNIRKEIKNLKQIYQQLQEYKEEKEANINCEYEINEIEKMEKGSFYLNYEQEYKTNDDKVLNFSQLEKNKEIDDNLEIISGLVSNTKDIAIILSSEIDKQTEIIETIDNKTIESQNKIDNVNNRLIKIFKQI